MDEFIMFVDEAKREAFIVSKSAIEQVIRRHNLNPEKSLDWIWITDEVLAEADFYGITEEMLTETDFYRITDELIAEA
jgi:hypothetical protein